MFVLDDEGEEVLSLEVEEEEEERASPATKHGEKKDYYTPNYVYDVKWANLEAAAAA